MSRRYAVVISSRYDSGQLYHYFPIGSIIYESDRSWHLKDKGILMEPTEHGIKTEKEKGVKEDRKARSQTMLKEHYVELPDDYTQEDIDVAIVTHLLKQ